MEGLGEIGGLLQEGKMKFNEDARDTGIENYVDSVNLYEAPSKFLKSQGDTAVESVPLGLLCHCGKALLEEIRIYLLMVGMRWCCRSNHVC